MTNRRHLATQAIEDSIKLIDALEGLYENSCTLSLEGRSAVSLIHLTKEKLNTAFTRLGGSGPSKSNEELLQEYLESVKARKARETLKIEKQCIKKYINFLGNKSVTEADFGDIRRFIDCQAERGLREGTIHQHICSVRAFHRFLTQYYGYDNPSINDIKSSDYRGKVPNPYKREPLSKEEIRKLIHAAKSVQDKLIIAMLYYTGLRASELTNLRLGDVDIEKGIVRVERGKGGKERLVRYSKEDLGMLIDLWLKKERQSYLNARDGDHFFVSRSGKKLGKNSILEIVHEAAKRAGIQEVKGKQADGKNIYKVCTHVLRHTHATHANEDGVKFEDIQRQMGHTKPSTTMIYVKEPKEHFCESYERFQGLSTKPRRR